MNVNFVKSTGKRKEADNEGENMDSEMRVYVDFLINALD